MREKDEQILSKVNNDLGIILRAVHSYLEKNNSPVSFKITEGFRSVEKQNEYFKKGASLCDGIKTMSPHQKGLAVDIMATYEGEGTFDIEYYYYIASLIEKEAYDKGIKLKWGGFFKRPNGKRFIDGCHFEVEK
jgi:peptidoglycan L-alanyl-D-glutamate endopeptidase CwlK